MANDGLASSEPDFFSPQITEASRFFLELNPPDSEAFAVVCGGRERCASDYHVRREDFPYISIEFVAAGEALLILDGCRHRLTAGDIYVYGPGIPHEIECDPARPLVKYFVDVTGNKMMHRWLAPAPRPGQIVQTSSPGQILRIYDDLIDAGLRQTPFRKRICAALVEYLLLRIAETTVPHGAIGTDAFETYQRCRRYIETHYLQIRDLPDIAARCDVHPAYVCRLFKRYSHQGPWQYVIQLRIREAAERLQVGGTLVKTVAQELGFIDPFQFSRTFRRVLGLSPRQFIQLRRRSP